MLTLGERRGFTINLEPGLYAMDDDSGSGKTYFAQEVNKYRDFGLPVIAFTYNNLHLEDIKPGTKLIVFDRADMYPNQQEIRDFIDPLLKTAIVLVDIKNASSPLNSSHLACFKLKKDGSGEVVCYT